MQIFHRSTNTISRVSIFGAVFAVALLLGLFDKINRSSWMTQAHVTREQPIQFSHERHVAGNGLDCSVFARQRSGIVSTRPWHVTQPTPLCTWIEWSKYTKPARS